MSASDDASYYRRRANEEWSRAQDSADASAAAAHRRLAELYSDRASQALRRTFQLVA